MTALCISAVLLLAYLFIRQTESALKERVLLQLSSVRQLKATKIKTELKERIVAFQSIYLTDSLPTINHHPLFQKIGRTATIPKTIEQWEFGDFQLFSDLQVIDVTPLPMNEPITVAIVRRLPNDEYLYAIAELFSPQSILLERTGLGETGESYLVGSDFKLKSKSRFNHGRLRSVDAKSEAIEKALNGESGESIVRDYRGTMVFSSYGPISEGDVRWAILSEIDYDEAMYSINDIKEKLLYIVLAILAIIALASFGLASMIVRPIKVMEKKLATMADGILDGVPTHVDQQDEIGRMFEALNKLVKALDDTVIYAGHIGSGNFNAEYTPLSDQDKLGAALISMRNQLRDFKRAEEHMRIENQKSVINGEEKERTRLSKELHDGLGPLLTTLRLNIQSEIQNSGTRKALLSRLDDTIDEVRRISNNLMPSVLADFGVGEAINNLVSDINSNHDIKIRFKQDVSPTIAMDDALHITMYRIAQESINNVLKHSKATEVKISVTAFEDHLSYFIADNGQGFNLDKVKYGNGIRNMRERTTLVNGTMDIKSGSKGTTIEIEIPIV